MWESLIIVSVILVFFFTRNENKKREERERIEEENKKIEEERVIREQERIEKERVLREQNEREEQERREQERLNREFWFELDGLETERELNKVFEKLGYKSELTPPQNDEGIDHVLNGEIVVQTKNTQSKVSRPDLQRFWGSWKDSHKKGIFVSIHGFSNTCEEFVKLEDKPILLYDVDDVVRMMEGKKPEWKDSSNKDSEGS